MPLATKLRGYQAQLGYTIGSGSETHLGHLSSVDVDVKADTIDFTDHDTSGWKDKGSGLKEFSGTAKLMKFTGSTSQDDIFNALAGNTDIQADFRQVDAVGETCYTGIINVTGYKMSAGMSDAQAIDITFEGRGALTKGTIVTVLPASV